MHVALCCISASCVCCCIALECTGGVERGGAVCGEECHHCASISELETEIHEHVKEGQEEEGKGGADGDEGISRSCLQEGLRPYPYIINHSHIVKSSLDSLFKEAKETKEKNEKKKEKELKKEKIRMRKEFEAINEMKATHGGDGSVKA